MRVPQLLLAVALSAVFTIAAAVQTPLTKVSDFCSLQDHDPITPTCFGFMSAIIGVVIDGRYQGNPEFAHICLQSSSAELVVTRMRPYLRIRGEPCEGHCDATSEAISALAAVYPCQKSN